MLTATEQSCEGLTLDACRFASSERFAGTCGWMDVRWLWSRGPAHHFRVNGWRISPDGSERRIERSEFVTVDLAGQRQPAQAA